MANTIIPIPNKRIDDLTNRRFGNWFVLGYVGYYTSRTAWLCRCDCGVERIVAGCGLTTGKSTNCGCVRYVNHFKKHGMTDSAEHRIWRGILTRCYNKNHHSYQDYGGRGITVCQRWRDSFQAFYDDMGPRPSPKHSINRINNNAGYEPDNCEWITNKEQSNNRRSNVLITLDGITLNINQWADRLRIRPSTLYSRVRLGWSEKDILTKPIKSTGQRWIK